MNLLRNIRTINLKTSPPQFQVLQPCPIIFLPIHPSHLQNLPSLSYEIQFRVAENVQRHLTRLTYVRQRESKDVEEREEIIERIQNKRMINHPNATQQVWANFRKDG